MAALSLLAFVKTTAAAEMMRACPHCNCPDGCCDEVISHVCKMIEVKVPIKKIVYECKEIPYCEHMPPRLHDCGCCPQCKSCPKYKRVLIKKEIICGEKCETKCVVEEIRTPCRHCGTVPCDQAPAGAGSQPTTPQPTNPAIDNAAKAKPAFFVPPVVSVSRPKSQRISD